MKGIGVPDNLWENIPRQNGEKVHRQLLFLVFGSPMLIEERFYRANVLISFDDHKARLWRMSWIDQTVDEYYMSHRRLHGRGSDEMKLSERAHDEIWRNQNITPDSLKRRLGRSPVLLHPQCHENRVEFS